MADIGAGATIPLSKIEPLTGSNYQVWALKISSVLRSRKLFKEVIQDPEPPDSGEPGSNEAKIRELWESKNDEAFGIIIITLSEEQAGLFINETSAKSVWDELKRIHAGNVEDRRIDVSLELKNIRMKTDELVDDYITRARNIASRSAKLGYVIPTREIVYHIVRGLHPKLEKVAAVLRTQRSATLEEVHQALREEETRLERGPSTHIKLEKAYKAAKDSRQMNDGWNRNKNTRACYVCGRTNHLAKECRERRDKQNSNEGRREYGHHYDRGRQKNNWRENRRKEHANVATKQREEHALTLLSEHQVCATNYSSESEMWTLDSGCSNHMTKRVDWMTDVESLNCKVNLAEEGRSITAEAKGNVKIYTTVNNGKEKMNLCIKDVLYVPKLRSNLLSVKSLLGHGNKVIFEGEKAKIYNSKNRLIAEANEKDRMFVLEAKPRNESLGRIISCLEVDEHEKKETGSTINIDQPQSNIKAKGGNDDKLLWHRRLGHMNDEYLERMKCQNMVYGLDFKSEKLGQCEQCIMGKMVQDVFQRVDNTSKRPLEMLHMDLCGPMPKASLGNAKYMYVIVDGYSRRIFVYFLKTKDEAIDCFTEFANRYENDLGVKIKHVRSDNGTEFVNREFEELFKARGIDHQRTVTYTPQSNGIAERANRTLLDMARTMLIDSELPIQFWAETVATAAYIKNCSPTKDGGTTTPIEKWSGNKPTVKHVKTFGCLGFYHVPKPHRNKFEPKANKGIFVGYSRIRRAYRIYDPKDGKIHEVRSVKFNENEKGAKLLQGKDNSFDLEVLNYENVFSPTDNDDSDIFLSSGNEQMTVRRNDPSETQIGLHDNTNSVLESTGSEENSNSLGRKPGRKLGETNEIIQIRHQNELIEREHRLIDQGVRRSERIRAMHEANTTMEDTNIKLIPNNFEEAINSPYSKAWRTAMEEEIGSMNMHNVWSLTPRTNDMKVIKSKWVYSIKEKPDGSIDKRKARLVAVGCGQKPGIDYGESFAPVMKLESLRTLIAIASQNNLKMKQYDVKTAYLHGELKEKIYMEQPKGFVRIGEEDKVCELQKSLYGLPQSGRCWNEKMNNTLTNNGLKRMKSDPCIYTLERDGKILIMGVYVDDIIAFGSNDDIIDETMEKLRGHFTITESNGEKFFLGMEIIECKDGYELSQKKYAEKILGRFGLANCNPVKTPGDPNQNLDQCNDSPLVNQKEYQEMLGSLMYMAIGTRPDISFNVSQLSQYSKEPRQCHLTAVKRIYRYLQGTKESVLKYSRQETEIKLNVSTDASWDSSSDAKSFTGYSVKLGDCLLHWKSQKQTIVALSTCEAELIALCEGVREVKWFSGFLSELNMYQYCRPPITVHTDSKAAIDWVNSSALHSRTKHINRKYFFVKDEVEKGNIQTKFVRSNEMEADVFTKCLTAEKINECKKRLRLVKL